MVTETTRASRYIRWFRDITLEDLPLVGGKNASLGEMHRELMTAGVRVSEGFAITAEASASLPSSARSLSATQGPAGLPVAADTLSASAMSAPAPAKSPIHALAKPNAERWSGSSATAPASRTS